MRRYLLVFLLLLSVLFCGCFEKSELPQQTIATEQTIPLSDGTIQIMETVPLFDNTSVLCIPGDSFSCGIRSDYYRIPSRGRVSDGDGLFLICADETEMNQGCHYDALFIGEDGAQNVPRSFFLQEYEILGQPIEIAFEYAFFDGRYVVTYVSEDLWHCRIYTDCQTENGILLILDLMVDGRSLTYPVFLNPQTGAVTDFLAPITPANLPSESINSLEMMEQGRLLVRMNGGSYYFYDTPNGDVYPLSDLAGFLPAACAAVPNGIVCLDGFGGFKLIDTESRNISDITLDISKVELFYGLTTVGNQTFALYRDESDALHAFDFISMKDYCLSVPEDWQLDPDRVYPSYDGRKLYLFRWDDHERIQILLFDCDLGQFILLERENHNSVRESGVSWIRDGSLVIESESGQDFYVYQWKEQDTQMTDTEITVSSQPRDTDFVPVLDYIPDLVVEMKYAYSDNFTGHAIYEFEEAWLRYGTVKKLMAVQDALRPMGLGLKLWDGFRPVAAQFKLWEILPDDTYVANPNIGFSSHSRGNTVDITLVDRSGVEVPMPTGFDDFSSLADRDYSDCPAALADNAILLENIMQEKGFVGYFGEWWHFADSVKYDVEKCFNPGIISTWYADCNEYISLRSAPDTSSQVLDRIPVRETCTLLGYTGDFALVDFRGQRGYVLSAYLKQVP